MRRPLRLFILVALTALLPAAAAGAETFNVTNPSSSGMGTLRDAIDETNFREGLDTISIQVTGEINLTEALPAITDEIEIVGPGADSLTVRRDVSGGFRIFNFSSGATAASVSGLTIANGLAASGAGINNGSGSLTLVDVVVTANQAVTDGGTQSVARGGGISSIGPLTLRESEVSENIARAKNGSSQTVAQAGGVSAIGALTLVRSTITGNLAIAEVGGSQSVAQGGGLQALGEPALIEQSTISGNTASAGGGGVQTIARAGGLQGSDGLTLTGSTVAGNSVVSTQDAGAANVELFGTHVVRNTIVVDPIGAESCSAPLTSGGFNLDEDSSCEFGQATDLEAVDPQLGPLADNGGPTPTHALLPGSAAIDRGNAFGSPADQRGLPRPSDFATVSNTEGGDGSDIGAFEVQAPPQPALPALRVGVVSGDRQPPGTRIVSGPPRVTFKRLAKFRFASTEAQSRFQCKVDKRRWRGCRNPFKRRVGAGVGPGRKHVFKVRAIDRFGNVDPTPARFGWRVKRIVR